MASWLRETRFALRDRRVLAVLALAVLLSLIANASGVFAIQSERELLARLQTSVHADRSLALEDQPDPGSAAYYSFHLTYDSPAAAAFASYRDRLTLPWMHRLRMLALEGQIYEADTGNPALVSVALLDLRFLAAYLVPLLLLLLLYDSESSERSQSRFALLWASAVEGRRLFGLRAAVRAALLYLALAGPTLVAGILFGVEALALAKILTALLLGVGLWLVIARLLVLGLQNGTTVAVAFLGVWLLTALAIPELGRVAAEASYPVPDGGEILLLQRETVNDAWDLPKAATMDPFVESHPQWAERAEVTAPFEWKWYYAFQQMGDERAAPLAQALASGIRARHEFMGAVALASPPLLIDRFIAAAAGTDRPAHQRYERCVRQFHGQLRDFYYPLLFGERAYSPESMADLPVFRPCSASRPDDMA